MNKSFILTILSLSALICSCSTGDDDAVVSSGNTQVSVTKEMRFDYEIYASNTKNVTINGDIVSTYSGDGNKMPLTVRSSAYYGEVVNIGYEGLRDRNNEAVITVYTSYRGTEPMQIIQQSSLKDATSFDVTMYLK